MTPKEVKFINARCEEMNWLTEKIQCINALALIAADGGKTITISINVKGENQPDELVYQPLIPSIIKTWAEKFPNKNKSTYSAEISDEETLAILGILMGELMDQQSRVKNYLTKKGITI